MIRRHLHLTPTPLPQILWDLLRKHCTIRQFREEVIHQFQRCVPVAVPDTLFARTVDRTLQAAFALFPQTDPVRVVFVHADHDAASLVYSADEATLYVQDRWLNVHGAHRDSDCATLRLVTPPDREQDYFCDHVVEELYGLAIDLISHEHQTLHRPFQLPSHARDHVRDRLRQMPRMVQATPSPRGGIRVTWTDGEPAAWAQLYGAQIRFRVSLHEENCDRDPAHRLLHHEPQSSAETEESPGARCSCPTTTATHQTSAVDFDHLEDSRKYFPAVSRAETGAFYGISPPSVQPLAPVDEIQIHDESSSMMRETTDQQTQTSPTDGLRDDPGPIGAAFGEAEQILAQWRQYQDPTSCEDYKNSRLEQAFRRLRPTHCAPDVRASKYPWSQPLTSK